MSRKKILLPLTKRHTHRQALALDGKAGPGPRLLATSAIPGIGRACNLVRVAGKFQLILSPDLEIGSIGDRLTGGGLCRDEVNGRETTARR